ncbi:MAG: hypothetical protein ABIU05_09820 [Nitrospirales bacterium]
MKKVTLDTNIALVEKVTSAVSASDFDFAVISVTDRELSGSTVHVSFASVGRITETLVLGESALGQGVLGGWRDADCFEDALGIISNNAFPEREQRSNLTPGQRRQLRDAMIFCAHVRARRDILVTNDERGFIDGGRRGVLEERFNTKIMTADEFIAAHASPGR